eukprot:g26780.t1
MAATDRNSGHFVQGHVDEAGEILKFTPEGDSLWVRISLSDDILPYVIPKGYIAVDGTSLTVCEVNRKEKWFNLMLIAHTQKCIVIPKKKYAATAVGNVRHELKELQQQLRVTQVISFVALCTAAALMLNAVRAR